MVERSNVATVADGVTNNHKYDDICLMSFVPLDVLRFLS